MRVKSEECDHKHQDKKYKSGINSTLTLPVYDSAGKPLNRYGWNLQFRAFGSWERTPEDNIHRVERRAKASNFC